jgi:hypothetical protein
MSYAPEQQGNYVRKVVLLWVRRNRPDVFAAAKKEAQKRFPHKAPVETLPGALEKLK